MRKNGIIIAIDGPTASGKSTTAKRVAAELGYLHLNTGAMYRAIALASTRSPDLDISRLLESTEIEFNDRGHVCLNGVDVSHEIILPQIADLASELSQIPEVRKKLVEEQRSLGEAGGVVLEGRDIGTVVFPDAELKIFLVADPTIRAERRREELARAGTELSLEEVKRQLAERDRRDEERELSPLRKAEDAKELDTTKLSIKEQVERVVRLARNISSKV